ncbi:NAD(P)-binding domain-containing protein [Candidatus Omnitrophota bacterium]
MKQSYHDVAVIGAGPIGLEMTVALKKAGIDYILFDKGQVGQTITWFPRLMKFFSSPDRIAIAGVPIPRTDESKCSREEFFAVRSEN